MFVPNPWYVFLRLHHLMCERLGKLKHDAELAAREKEEDQKLGKGMSVAALLKCEPKGLSVIGEIVIYSDKIRTIENLKRVHGSIKPPVWSRPRLSETRLGRWSVISGLGMRTQ